MSQNQNLGNFGRFVNADVVANTASISGNVTISKITIANVYANGSLGTNGQALTTNGSAVYWSTIVGTNTDATYVWTNNHTFNANVTIGNSTINSIINSTASVMAFGHMNRQTIDYNYTVPGNVNVVVAGPVSVATGYTLTIANGARVAVV